MAKRFQRSKPATQVKGLVPNPVKALNEYIRFAFELRRFLRHPIPKISILPLVMIVLGIGEASKVAVVALSSFFPVVINTMAGVSQISPVHFEVAHNYGARRFKVLTRVVLPGSLPLVLTGLRLALNTALLLSISVELVAAQTGLGAMIWLAWQTLRTEELYAAILVTSLLGVGFNLVIQALSHWLVPWQGKE